MTPTEETSQRGAIDLALITDLYRTYAEQLCSVRQQQRALLRDTPGVRPQLDDIEAELTYLLIRHERPDRVVEIGSRGGWSTTWILHALADNANGQLLTMDLVPDAIVTVPKALAGRRWEFRRGDARTLPVDWPAATDYLFIDADHGARFARWYLSAILPTLRTGTLVSVHDVFHRPRPWPGSEGREVLRARGSLGYFTAAPAAPDNAFRELQTVRATLGLTDPIRYGTHNPMIYFRT